jgi:molybdopterin synthase sulfur carrier subunit
MVTVTVRYFAQLRDRRGQEQERIETAATTLRALYDELAARHALPQPPRGIMVAVDDDLARWDADLHAGDTVAFLPPVSGG